MMNWLNILNYLIFICILLLEFDELTGEDYHDIKNNISKKRIVSVLRIRSLNSVESFEIKIYVYLCEKSILATLELSL